MMTLPSSANFNRILRALPDYELATFRKYLEPVELTCGQILQPSGESTGDVYFPETCVISAMRIFENGSSIESGCVGSEGLAGAELYLSRVASNRETRVQISGRALKMRAEYFNLLIGPGTTFQRLVKEYLAFFVEQCSQIGACTCFHTLNARLARLLLTYRKCLGTSRIKLTHENMAQILGSCRPVISEAASQLKDQGYITYIRGAVSIVNLRGLEIEACECYGLIRQAYENYDSLLGQQFEYQPAGQNAPLPAVRQNFPLPVKNRYYQLKTAAQIFERPEINTL